MSAPRRGEAQWLGIDADIFAHRIMGAVAKVQAADRCAFRDALHKVRARHDRLRERAPERFSVTVEDYWDGFGTILRRKAKGSAPPAMPKTRPAERATASAPEVARRKGERRVVVDGVAYYWRVPRRASSNQRDLVRGVLAMVRRADGQATAFVLEFPQPHPEAAEGAVPVLPSDVAEAIRESVARG